MPVLGFNLAAPDFSVTMAAIFAAVRSLQVLKEAKCDKKDVHEIVLVGGSSRIPKVQEMLK